MAQFGIATITAGNEEALAVLSGGRVLPLARAAAGAGLAESAAPRSMRAALADWERWCGVAEAAAARPAKEGWVDAAVVEFRPAITDPPNVYCAGANYYDHVREMGFAPPDASRGMPYHFIASTSVLNGHNQPVTRPTGCEQFDWEVELAVVIGTDAFQVPAAEAMSVIAGYTVANDLSLRDFGRRDDVPFFPDWLMMKCSPGCLPLGPAVVPARQVPDPMNLQLWLRVNDETRQSSNTKEMIYPIARQIEFLSHILPLRRGDVILTGTPAGTAARWNRYLQPGDVMEAEVELLGTLITRVAAP
jgi:2-keto-4-pentenoate hydratase/2-oxohepta-3-ene-1,7-dioic acid hydratase in catechol pathway